MSGVGVIGAIIIGILAGWIAERLMNRNHGIFTNLIVGVMGSFIGAWIAGAMGWTYNGWTASLAVSVLGAVLLLGLLGLLKR